MRPASRSCSIAPVALLALLAGPLCLPAQAETGADGWLRYAPLPETARTVVGPLPSTLVVLGDWFVLRSARDEIVRGIGGMTATRVSSAASLPAQGDAIVLGTLAAVRAQWPSVQAPGQLLPDGFWLRSMTVNGRRLLIVAGQDDRGALYGAFDLLRRVAVGTRLEGLDVRQDPAAPIRWVNEWNNLDGSIERGYAGPSIFFTNNTVRRRQLQVARRAIRR